jgi:hypothetical protein
VSELIGRDDDLGAIRSLAAAHRLVTLTGAGGIGKTRLSLEVARHLLPRFANGVWAIDDRSRDAFEICRRLDGIPLAIELAAGRAAALGIEGVTARLHNRFPLLSGGHRTAMPRHQTLRATLDWSYELLTEPERVVLPRLAIFAGGFFVAEGLGELEGAGPRGASLGHRASRVDQGCAEGRIELRDLFRPTLGRCGMAGRRLRRLGDDPDLLAIDEVDGRLQDHPIAVLDPVGDLDRGAVIGGDRDFAEAGRAVLIDRDLHAVLIENDRGGRDHQRR